MDIHSSKVLTRARNNLQSLPKLFLLPTLFFLCAMVFMPEQPLINPLNFINSYSFSFSPANISSDEVTTANDTNCNDSLSSSFPSHCSVNVSSELCTANDSSAATSTTEDDTIATIDDPQDSSRASSSNSILYDPPAIITDMTLMDKADIINREDLKSSSQASIISVDSPVILTETTSIMEDANAIAIDSQSSSQPYSRYSINVDPPAIITEMTSIDEDDIVSKEDFQSSSQASIISDDPPVISTEATSNMQDANTIAKESQSSSQPSLSNFINDDPPAITTDMASIDEDGIVSREDLKSSSQASIISVDPPVIQTEAASILEDANAISKDSQSSSQPSFSNFINVDLPEVPTKTTTSSSSSSSSRSISSNDLSSNSFLKHSVNATSPDIMKVANTSTSKNDAIEPSQSSSKPPEAASQPVISNTRVTSFRAPKSCDIFKGEWVPDPDAPYYTNMTCNMIQEHQNCMKYGRPDMDFLKWRWKPDGCELPHFDPIQFLELVRGKSMAFVGDSLARNHMQSLLCLLSKVEIPEDVDVPDERIKCWYYANYKFTVTIFWSPFLVRAQEMEKNGLWYVHLDKIDNNWATRIQEFDYLIISASNWFTRPSMYFMKSQLSGCNYCYTKKITNWSLYYANKLAFRTVFYAINSASRYKGLTILRTVSPSHFENGPWNEGGNCNRTRPIQSKSTKFPASELEMYKAQMEVFKVARMEARKMRREIKMIDMTNSMLQRPDGHPNQYGHWPQDYVASHNDCVHWCLPGPVDLWNQFLIQMLM